MLGRLRAWFCVGKHPAEADSSRQHERDVVATASRRGSRPPCGSRHDEKLQQLQVSREDLGAEDPSVQAGTSQSEQSAVEQQHSGLEQHGFQPTLPSIPAANGQLHHPSWPGLPAAPAHVRIPPNTSAGCNLELPRHDSICSRHTDESCSRSDDFEVDIPSRHTPLGTMSFGLHSSGSHTQSVGSPAHLGHSAYSAIQEAHRAAAAVASSYHIPAASHSPSGSVSSHAASACEVAAGFGLQAGPPADTVPARSSTDLTRPSQAPAARAAGSFGIYSGLVAHRRLSVGPYGGRMAATKQQGPGPGQGQARAHGQGNMRSLNQHTAALGHTGPHALFATVPELLPSRVRETSDASLLPAQHDSTAEAGSAGSGKSDVTRQQDSSHSTERAAGATGAGVVRPHDAGKTVQGSMQTSNGAEAGRHALGANPAAETAAGAPAGAAQRDHGRLAAPVPHDAELGSNGHRQPRATYSGPPVGRAGGGLGSSSEECKLPVPQLHNAFSSEPCSHAYWLRSLVFPIPNMHPQPFHCSHRHHTRPHVSFYGGGAQPCRTCRQRAAAERHRHNSPRKQRRRQ